MDVYTQWKCQIRQAETTRSENNKRSTFLISFFILITLLLPDWFDVDKRFPSWKKKSHTISNVFQICSPPTGFISAVFDQHQSNPVRSTFIPFDPPSNKTTGSLSRTMYTHTDTHTETQTHAKTLYHEPRHTRTAQGLRTHTRNFFGHTLCQGNNFLAAVWTSTNTGTTTTTVNRLGSKSLVCCADVVCCCCPGTNGWRGGRRSAWLRPPLTLAPAQSKRKWRK